MDQNPGSANPDSPINLPWEAVQAHRAGTFGTAPGLRLHNVEQAAEYVRQRGFIFFWPIRDVTFPSLWTAAAGDRPVPDAHDDPGHVTWGWKDSQLGGQSWYYAKVLRKKSTLISMDVAPHFYALSENYGSPEEDYLTLYRQGRLTLEAKQVFEALLEKGPLDSIALRRAARLTSKESEERFNRALTDLQTGFMILPTAVADAGSWHYAFAYNLTARAYPQIVEQARFIDERTARRTLLASALGSLGAAPIGDLRRLFGWPLTVLHAAVDDLILKGDARRVSVEGQTGDWISTTE